MFAHILYDIPVPNYLLECLKFISVIVSAILVLCLLVAVTVYLIEQDVLLNINLYIKYYNKKKPTNYFGCAIGDRVLYLVGRGDWSKVPATIKGFGYSRTKEISYIILNDNSIHYRGHILLQKVKKVIDPRPEWY